MSRSCASGFRFREVFTTAKLRLARHNARHERVTEAQRAAAHTSRLRRSALGDTIWLMAIQLVTFGGLHATSDDGELDWLLGQHSRAALFVYLAVERRVSREALTALFWPESDAENARHALRQGLYHLRRAVGSEWIDSRAHELVVSDDIRL